MATIGLFVGRENTFPEPFIEHINRRAIPGISAELVKLGGTRLDEPFPYRVIIDRISHEVPYYRCYLKAAALQGTIVINDPFWWGNDDKYLESLIAQRVGVAVPRTLLLPNKGYIEGVSDESLRNLVAPLDWEGMLDYVGRPAILKPAIGGGWKNVYKVYDAAELIRCFDQTGQLQMILQEFIEFEQYVRCLCLGRQKIQPIRYDPMAPFESRYILDDSYLEPALYERVVKDARALNEALGYDMNTVEFAIRGGVPYAIDFLNPAPDFDDFSIKQQNFEWVIETMADLAIAYAQGNEAPPQGYIWQENPHRPTPPRSPFAAQVVEVAEIVEIVSAVPTLDIADEVSVVIVEEIIAAVPTLDTSDEASAPISEEPVAAPIAPAPTRRSRAKAQSNGDAPTPVTAAEGSAPVTDEAAPKPRRSRKKTDTPVAE